MSQIIEDSLCGCESFLDEKGLLVQYWCFRHMPEKFKPKKRVKYEREGKMELNFPEGIWDIILFFLRDSIKSLHYTLCVLKKSGIFPLKNIELYYDLRGDKIPTDFKGFFIEPAYVFMNIVPQKNIFKGGLKSLELYVARADKELVSFINNMPPTLEHLRLDYFSSNQKNLLEISWPKSLLHLQIGDFDLQFLKGYFHENLLSLHINGSFDQEILESLFPNSLKELIIGPLFRGNKFGSHEKYKRIVNLPPNLILISTSSDIHESSIDKEKWRQISLPNHNFVYLRRDVSEFSSFHYGKLRL